MSCQIFSKITKLVNENPKRYSQIITADPLLLEEIRTLAGFNGDYVPELVYAVLHPDESRYCGKGNRRKFRNINLGWNKCDEPRCSSCAEATLAKTKRTCLANHGVENPMQIPGILDKMRARSKERHGVEHPSQLPEVKEKHRVTNLERYGQDHFWKTSAGQAARRQTMVDRYGAENPSQNKDLQKKKEQTWLDNYGVSHPMHDPLFRAKCLETLSSRYGVTNAGNVPGSREKAKTTTHARFGVDYASQNLEVVEQFRQTMLERYGETSPMHVPEFRDKAAARRRQEFIANLPERISNLVIPCFETGDYLGVKHQQYQWQCRTCDSKFTDAIDNGGIPLCPCCFPSVQSKGEEELFEYIRSLYDGEILRNSRSIIDPLELDLYLPSLNLAFEYNGVYHHRELSGSKDRNYHVNKFQRCRDLGIRLVQILDIEWNLKQPIVQSRIRQALNLSNRIYARNCQLVEISKKQKSVFLTENHIQGDCASSYDLGLTFNNELIAVMTFIKSRFNRNYDYELARFCNKINHSVVGGASRLFRNFLVKQNPRSVISYCDLRWNTGSSYEKMGFTNMGASAPNYWYTAPNSSSIESRLKYQKHKLSKILKTFDPKLSEWENMQVNGYDRIWDCGNQRFVFNRESDF